MLEKKFAKYARAVSDDKERQYLFRKFKIKTVVSIIFYILCVVVIVAALVLENRMAQDWVMITMGAVVLIWLGVAIANLCLWLSFRAKFKEIINRPAAANEMPEITEYRAKCVKDKQSAFAKLWWAWLIFFICVAVFLAFITVETIKNPDSEQFGVWGGAAIAVLFAGAMVLACAYFVYTLTKQQKGKSLEQQTAGEATAIDAAQGRKSEYSLEEDTNLRSYKYLFPDGKIRAEVESVRKKYSKTISFSMIGLAVIALTAVILLMCSEKLGKNISGYAFPVAVTLIFVWVALFSIPANAKLKALEKKQAEELRSNPEYSENAKLYELYVDFSRFKGKVYVIFIVLGIALGWVLAALFPTKAWALLAIVPMMIGLFINNFLVKNLRQKAVLIEKEIDLKVHDVRFFIEEGGADGETCIYYDGDSLMSKGGYQGGITLSLEGTNISLEVEEGSNRVVNFSSIMIMPEEFSEIPDKETAIPQDKLEGTLFARLGEGLTGGTWQRIAFTGSDFYDRRNKIYLVGEFDCAKPCYKIFTNVYVQLSEEGVLQAVAFTDIEVAQNE